MDRPNTPSVSAADRAKIGALSSRPKEADYQPLPPPQIRGKVYDATMQEAIERVNPDEFMDHGSEGFKKKIGFPITIPGLPGSVTLPHTGRPFCGEENPN